MFNPLSTKAFDILFAFINTLALPYYVTSVIARLYLCAPACIDQANLMSDTPCFP